MTKKINKIDSYKKITVLDIEDFFINRSKYMSPEKLVTGVKKEAFDGSVILNATKDELERLMKKARIKDGPKPFFASAFIQDEKYYTVNSIGGNIWMDNENHERSVNIVVKVGSSHNNEFTNNVIETSRIADGEPEAMLPLDDDYDGIREAIWLAADPVFRKSVSSYYTKMSDIAGGEQTLPKGAGVWSPNYNPPENNSSCYRPKIPKQKLKDLAQVISSYLKTREEITDHEVLISGKSISNILYTTDGVEYVYPSSIFTVDIIFTVKKNNKNKEVQKNIVHSNVYSEELPTFDMFKKEIDISIAYIMLYRNEEKIKQYIGPALLSGLTAGTFFHEVIGHRMESGRLLSIDERSGLLNQKADIVHPDLLFFDDPTITNKNNIYLTGSYPVDEEGVAPSAVTLVSDGKAKGFMNTRTSIKSRGHKSNGHSRSDKKGFPEARMGVSVITSSRESYSWEYMKQMLLKSINNQGLEFGIIILESQHGETLVNSWDIQSFRGESDVILMITKDGALKPIEPIDFIGVPLMALKSMLAIGDNTTQSVENHGCGSGSGVISVSTICPAILLKSVEMQEKGERRDSPILSHPKFELK